MIPRLLVPRDVRPAETPPTPPLRLTTLLDSRVIVAPNLPRVPLQTRSAIPSHLPLDALASRVVVPRDMPMTPLDPASFRPGLAPPTPTLLDQRIAVPVALPVVDLAPKSPVAIQDLPEVLDSDVFTTGEVNLMVAQVEQPARNWNWIARVGSPIAHLAFLALLLLQPKLFPYQPPTQEEIEIARRQLSFIYMPPEVPDLPPEPPAPQIRIDPRVLRRITPPEELQPMPQPRFPDRAVRNTPSEGPPELPPAPTPEPSGKAPDFLRGSVQARSNPEPEPFGGRLVLPRMSSPGRTLEESAQQAIRGGGATEQFGGPIPGGGNTDGRASGYAGAGIHMLTPTEGVDFTSYLARALASVKRNWYAVMPESARLGDQGRVVLQFRILRDGAVPRVEPYLMAGSGREPLDRAAIASIRSSSPFGPLPPAFRGAQIELRFIFLYNLPLNSQ